MASVRVVLVRPESAANIGACARVVRNTGASGLDLVAPGDWRTTECWRSAWGAHDVLEQAREFPELPAALGGAALAVAFTGRRRRDRHPEDVRDAAARVALLRSDEVAALVFGPETSGLSNEELGACGVVASIPSHPAQPSFNLSHAVAIAAYEAQRARGRAADEPPRRATHEEKEHLLALLREGLRAIGALPSAPERFSGWRALVQRSELRQDELRLLEHAARKMASARGSASGKAE